MMIRSLTAILAALTIGAPAWAIDISQLHQNNSSGVPLLLNQQVTVGGVVTSPDFVYSSSNFEIYIQDATGGVNVFVSGASGHWPAVLGDSLTVTATVSQYSGLTEIGTTTAQTSVVNHGPASSPPQPLVLTCAQVNYTWQPDYSEPNEGRLVRVNDLTITSGTWPVTPQGGNSSIYVTDGTATVLLFIDKDTAVNGSPDPGANFDLIGILKQYDTSAPYSSGYEIVPRYITDVISEIPGPQILGMPVVRNVTSTSAEVHFSTVGPGSSEVEYGVSESYGSTAGDPGAMTTEHIVAIEGLSSNVVYHFRVKSTDAQGTTASDVPGEIHIAMSYTADESYADPGNEVPESQSLSNLLVQLINGAQYSVDAALYSFSLNSVRDALIGANHRGVLVRIIIDDGNDHTDADYCAAYGIPYITSTYGGNHGAPDYGIMHNKFVVIDGRDTDPYNDWVFTGSANMSVSGDNDVNSSLRIKDYGLAQAYTLEFNEMWGSDTQTPNASQAHMGNRKADNTPHEFTIDGLRVECYQSPSDGTTAHISEAMETADYSVYFAILTFTDYTLSDAMRDHRDATGIELRGVFDKGLGACDGGSVYYEMAGDPCSAPYAWDVPADVWVDTPLPSDRLLHHKYMIVDANAPGSDPQVVAGSHNWSWSADNINDENTLIVHDQGVANMYLQEFAQRYHEAGGTAPLGEATAVEDNLPLPPGRLLGSLASFPNPFNPTTRLAFSTRARSQITVQVYDVNGRLVRTIAQNRAMEAGYHILGWNGRDVRDQASPSGTYLAVVKAHDPLTGQDEKATRKLVLVQ
jgi:phosphatidylserine/phosphatidylglycerophosphate/cardiolipin synthase-like enzyme